MRKDDDTPRPEPAGRTMGSYFPRELILRLDRWRAAQRRPMTRSEAIRSLVSDRLKND